MNRNAKDLKLPINELATYLWWRLNPAMEAVDVIGGKCVVMGPTSHGEPTDCTEPVIVLCGEMERIAKAIRASSP